MSYVDPPPDWQEMAEQAVKEKDPEKLAQTVQELCGAIDERCTGAPENYPDDGLKPTG